MTPPAELPKKYAAERVLVVPYDALRQLLPDVGVWPVSEALLQLIAAPSLMRRDEAEQTTVVTQLVAYYIVVNSFRVLTHRRTRRQPEKRLTDVRAIGLSGHMTASDFQGLSNRDLFHRDATSGYANRELAEEVAVTVSSQTPIALRCCIWEPIDDFGKQHLGLVYSVPAEEKVKVLEPGLISDAAFKTLPEIRSSIADYSSWSRLLLNSTIFADFLVDQV